MKRLTLIAFQAAASGCFSGNAEPELRATTRADITGNYGDSGSIGYLTLGADGTYECMVLNGMTVDGCGTVEGSGLSIGSWDFEGGSVSFVPVHEPDDLVVKLAGASAVPSGNGLVLTIGESVHFLARSVTQTERPGRAMPADSPAVRR